MSSSLQMLFYFNPEVKRPAAATSAAKKPASKKADRDAARINFVLGLGFRV